MNKMKKRYPPRWIDKLLESTISPELFEGIKGDLLESYESWRSQKGAFRANLNYCLQALGFLRFSILRQKQGVHSSKNFNMKRKIKYAFRYLWYDKFHNSLNIISLVVGVATSVIIFLYLQRELNFDKNNEKYKQIYRISNIFETSGNPVKFAIVSPALGPRLKEEYPEIRDYVRLRSLPRILFSVDDKKFYEDDIYFADSSLFTVFTFDFVSGNPANCLLAPHSLVINQTLAKKYFGNEDPIGKIILLENQENYKVTGVFRDLPQNTHVPIHAVVPHAEFDEQAHSLDWPIYEISSYTYLYVTAGFNPEEFTNKLGPFYKKYVEPNQKVYNQVFVPVFQRLDQIHYGRNDLRADFPTANKNHLYIFGLIGVLILFLSCVNYINLATARAEARLKSIWVKKVVGASRISLMFENLIESVILSLLAIVLGLVIAGVILREFAFSQVLNLKLDLLHNLPLAGLILIIFGLTGWITGLYPSLYLSGFSINNHAGQRIVNKDRSNFIRNSLVLFQFVISVFVINLTLMMHEQLHFVATKDMGFDKNILSIQVRDTAVENRYEYIKNDLLKYPEILSVSSGETRPGSIGSRLYRIQSENGDYVEQNFRTMVVNFDFMKTLGMEIIEGRDFDQSIPTDRAEAIMVNQKLVDFMRWENPIGKQIAFGSRQGVPAKVVGVVKDFNALSLHNEIQPLLIRMQQNNSGRILIRYKTENVAGLITFLQEKWKEINPNRPFVYDLLSDEFNRMYADDELQSTLVRQFSVISILISCLGLLGLASYSAIRKTKEIGIRKTLGASVIRIIVMLSKNVTLLVLVALLVASFISIFVFNIWLQSFAYKVDTPLLIFMYSGIITILVVWLTISFHFMKAATTNPVDVLRYE